jgi:hypothetical protein
MERGSFLQLRLVFLRGDVVKMRPYRSFDIKRNPSIQAVTEVAPDSLRYLAYTSSYVVCLVLGIATTCEEGPPRRWPQHQPRCQSQCHRAKQHPGQKRSAYQPSPVPFPGHRRASDARRDARCLPRPSARSLPCSPQEAPQCDAGAEGHSFEHCMQHMLTLVVDAHA